MNKKISTVEITLSAIGFVSSAQTEPYQASKQPDELSMDAVITLNSGFNFEQALTDLDGCSHLWIIYQFHKNENWKPLVQTPRSNRKIGVFATRSPYRPNAIGMSVVELKSIDGLKIEIGANDLLDGTPVLDIKPYHPEYDVMADAKIKWLETSLGPKFEIKFSPVAEDKLDYLESADAIYQLNLIKPFILRQLQYDPTNSDKKRVDQNNALWTLSYRTWRIDFIISEQTVAVLDVRTGYSDDDLNNIEDKYSDKKIHRKFVTQFS